MADISKYLQDILSAVYGEEVRGSIHDAIEIINDVSEVVLTTGTAISGPTSSSEGFFVDSIYLNISTMELWKCIGTDSWQSLGVLKGSDGSGITSIDKTGTSGLVDTYTITFDDGHTETFDITNGADGADGKNGSIWYKGTALSGTGTSITGFPGNKNDFYLNSTDGYVYTCVKAGGAMPPDAAEWDYVMTLTGGGGSSVTVIDNLTSTSSTDALSANQGRVLKGLVDSKASNTQTFTQASERANLVSGESLSTLFGKIMKWFADLKDLAFIAKDGVSSTKFLRGDGTWQEPPAGGHEMIPVLNDIATVTALTDGDDDYVINAYTAKRWSNVDAITLYTTLQAGTDTIGEWDDDWEQTTSRQGWMFHELLQGILTNDNVHYEITFDPLNKEVVVLNSWRVDDTYYAEVTSPSGNPSEQGFYELVGSTYVLTSDTTVQGGKTYYKLGGAVAIKFCYAPSVDVRVGIKLQILRTQVIPVEIL